MGREKSDNSQPKTNFCSGSTLNLPTAAGRRSRERAGVWSCVCWWSATREIRGTAIAMWTLALAEEGSASARWTDQAGGNDPEAGHRRGGHGGPELLLGARFGERSGGAVVLLQMEGLRCWAPAQPGSGTDGGRRPRSIASSATSSSKSARLNLLQHCLLHESLLQAMKPFFFLFIQCADKTVPPA
jgi:hypothetical protein